MLEVQRLKYRQVNKGDTVEPPCVTASRQRPPHINDRQSKTPKLSQSKPYSWNL